MKKILFVLIVSASTLLADFSRDDNSGIVTDNATQLMWQDDTNASTNETLWLSAIDRCEALSLDGYDDWRLPNQNELRSLVDRRYHNPAIDPVFQNVAPHPNNYWSATTSHAQKWKARYVLFYDGLDFTNDKDASEYVRCVRGGQ